MFRLQMPIGTDFAGPGTLHNCFSTGGNGGMLRNLGANYLLNCKKNMTYIMVISEVYAELYRFFCAQGTQNAMVFDSF